VTVGDSDSLGLAEDDRVIVCVLDVEDDAVDDLELVDVRVGDIV
jgi:hypothetical protein